MEDNIYKSETKKKTEDQVVTAIVAEESELSATQRKRKPGGDISAKSCNETCNHAGEVVSTTPVDELLSQPPRRVACNVRSKKGDDDVLAPHSTYATSPRSAASRTSAATRRPSDRLREKIAGSIATCTVEIAEIESSETKILDDSTSGAGGSAPSAPQSDGKTSPPSTSVPGAYAIPGIGARRGNEQVNRNGQHRSLSYQEQGENPIEAFIADDPVAAVALGDEFEQVERPSDSLKKDGVNAKHDRQRALLSVVGISSLIILVGVLVGVLVSKPNNDDDVSIVCQTRKIRPSDTDPNVPTEAIKLNSGMEFGQDLDVDGDTLIVAARTDDDETKVAYIFNKARGRWIQSAKLTPNSFVRPEFPIFGVAICDNHAFVAQSGDEPRGIRSGSVHVYEKDESSQWNFDSIIYPDDGAEEDMFGSSLACDASNLIVGAMHRHDQKEIDTTHSDAVDQNDRGHDGSAYIFSRQGGGGWLQTAKLAPIESNVQQQFGISVAISGGVAAVGSDKHNIDVGMGGSVHVFVYDGGNWTLADILLPIDLRYGDKFGASVDIDVKGNIAAGAKFRSSIGSAFIFRRQGLMEWTQEAELIASDGDIQSSFGNSVALLSSPTIGDIAIVGAWKDSELHDRSGAAYVYKRADNGSWNETIKLKPTELIRKSYFGNSVAVQEGTKGALEIFAGVGPLDIVYSFELCKL